MTKKKRSPAWNRFMEEFFNKPIYYQIHDGTGYLPEVVLDLDEKEKAEAEASA